MWDSIFICSISKKLKIIVKASGRIEEDWDINNWCCWNIQLLLVCTISLAISFSPVLQRVSSGRWVAQLYVMHYGIAEVHWDTNTWLSKKVTATLSKHIKMEKCNRLIISNVFCLDKWSVRVITIWLHTGATKSHVMHIGALVTVKYFKPILCFLTYICIVNHWI